ncbi:hypothetical protein GOBAR_AA28298 [Gossypium barbadense]|uniref:Uncharacterized protein n=1 Tax=Gossypium barbadense TaxID=3634 RepID=A0A2P5WMQ6_GOSBA|nr:hypothetical protein GOBAR_AA28298 [Gossypium barbadense]
MEFGESSKWRWAKSTDKLAHSVVLSTPPTSWARWFHVAAWNIVIFDNGNHFTEDIAKSVEKSLQEDKKRHMRVVRQIGWEAPQEGWIKIDTDGAVGSCQMGVEDIAEV